LTEVPLSIDSGALKLEAVLHLPDATPPLPAVVVCHPHPRYGGDMDNNVVGAIVRGVLAEGMAALAFNFRGVGRSEGAFDGGHGERDDLRAAIVAARARPEIDADRLGLAGYSFGAAMALACAGPGVRAMVFVGLPAGMAAEVAFAALEGEALFLSGDNDAFSTAESLKKIAAPLGERALVEIVAGVDHFWFCQESRVAATVGRFFKGRL
jgi:hypothetical protein